MKTSATLFLCTSFILMALGAEFGFRFVDIIDFWTQVHQEGIPSPLVIITPLIRITLLFAIICYYFAYRNKYSKTA